MRTAKTLTILAFLGLGAGSVLVAGCGDNAQTCGPGTEPNEDGFCLPTGEDGPDAEPGDEPDAEIEPDADESFTVAGTIAITDTTVTDPTVQAYGLASFRGGAIRISFNDLTDEDRGGEILFGTTPTAGCVITKYDANNPPYERLDAGTITLGGAGLLKTVGPCNLRPEMGEPDPYRCISHESNAGIVSATTIPDAVTPANSATAVSYTFPGVAFGMTSTVTITGAVRGAIAGLPANTAQITTSTPHGFKTGQFVVITGSGTFSTPVVSGVSVGVPISVTGANTFVFSQTASAEVGATFGSVSATTNAIAGSQLFVNGFTVGPNSPRFNSYNKSFFVIAQSGPNSVLAVNSAPAAAALPAGTSTLGAAVSYKFVNGNSPAPTTSSFLEFHDFLSADDLTVMKPAEAGVWGAINETIDIPGEALAPVAVTALSRTSNVVTATATNHGLSAGQKVTIANSTPPTLDLVGGARTGTGFHSYTTTAVHDLAVGDAVLITTNSDTSLNGFFFVVQVPTTTTFVTYGAGTATSGTGGTTTLKSMNGTFTVKGATPNTFTYDQAGNDAAAGITNAVLRKSSFALDTAILVGEDTGTGPSIAAGCTLTNTGMFAASLAGASVTITGSTTAANNGTFPITASTVNDITYTNANCAAEAFAAATEYRVHTATGASQRLYVFPTTTAANTADLNYSCDNNTSGTGDDTCGEGSSEILTAMIISGSATKQSVEGLFPFAMPDEIAGDTEWLEWQCAFLLGKSATMPVAAVQEIIDFGPTRVQQQLLYVAGGQLSDGFNVNTVALLAGHALAGSQTFCPAAGAGRDAANVPLCAACNNGIDDDGDGMTDFAGSDAGCTSASDSSE